MTVEDTIKRVARAIDDAYDIRSEGDLSVEQAIAALSSLRPGDKLPNGLVVVPEEPTQAMLRAGADASLSIDDPGWMRVRDAEEVWPAMLSAAANEEKAG